MKVTLRTLSVVVLVALLVTGALLAGGVAVTKRAIDDQRVATERQGEHRKLAIELADESDMLTSEARKLVVTGDRRSRVERRQYADGSRPVLGPDRTLTCSA